MDEYVQDYHNKGYKKDVIEQIQKLNWKQLLHQQKCIDKWCIPLSVTYSQVLPNLKDISIKQIKGKSNYRQIQVVKKPLAHFPL